LGGSGSSDAKVLVALWPLRHGAVEGGVGWVGGGGDRGSWWVEEGRGEGGGYWLSGVDGAVFGFKCGVSDAGDEVGCRGKKREENTSSSENEKAWEGWRSWF